MTKIKTLDIQAKEWFDKINGNSYFSGQVTINYGLKNEKTLFLPYQYGYGDSFEQAAKEILIENGFISAEWHELISRYCRDNKIILRSSIQTDCKKRDMKEFGQA